MNSPLKKIALALLATAALAALPLRAADMLIANYSFESALSGTWTQTFGAGNPNGSATATTAQAEQGSSSLQIVDNDPAVGFGMESNKLTVSGGTIYIAHARVKITSGSADLYIRYYNNSGGVDTYLAAGFTSISTPVSQWTNIQVKMQAPTNANRVSVLLYSNNTNTGTAYWDRVLITRQYTNLGAQLYDSAPNGTTFGKGAHAAKIFAAITGAGTYMPRMVVIDTATEAVTSTIAFPAGTEPIGAWGATTAEDGNVYFGTYSDAGLYKHVPGTSTLTRQPYTVPGSTVIYDLASAGSADGKIYGGSWAGGRVFKFTPTGGMDQLAHSGGNDTLPFIAGMEYVREIDFDPVQQALYMSIGGNGSNPGIYRWDVVNGSLHNVFASGSLANHVDVAGGRVFANIAGTTTVINVVENGSGVFQSASIDASFSGGSPVSPVNAGKVYVVSGGSLHSYQIGAASPVNLNKSMSGARVKRFGWVNGVLVGLTALNNQTYLMKYNPANGAFTHNPVSGVIKIPAGINEVQGGPDGKIYTGAYLTGGLGVYTPIRGDGNDATEEQMFSPISQIDRMASNNGLLYLGVYPGAHLYAYNPAQGWGGGNPQLLINSGTSNQGGPSYQDRPKAIAFEGTKVFMGSVGRTNMFDGAVSWYIPTASPTTGAAMVANASVISLAVAGTKLYAGTTIRRGYNTPPGTGPGKIRVYNITSSGLTYSTSLNPPSPGTQTSITKMITIGTGTAARIWGFADGYLFVLNPNTNTYDYSALKFSDVSHPNGTYRDADLVIVPKDPGHLYGTIKHTYLFKVNLTSKAVTNITSGADMAAVDAFGDVYYLRTADDTTLGRFSP